MPARSVLRAGAGAPYLVLFQRINLDFLKKDQHFSACLQQVSRAKRKGPPCCSDMQYWPPACTSGAIHFQFDRFSSLMLAMSGLFLSLFAHTFSRYWQRVVVGKAGERVVQRTLAELGLESIHDIYLPTHDGSRQLDHIALFPGSLAVIETKTYNGRLIMDGSNHWHRIGRRGACTVSTIRYGNSTRQGKPFAKLSLVRACGAWSFSRASTPRRMDTQTMSCPSTLFETMSSNIIGDIPNGDMPIRSARHGSG